MRVLQFNRVPTVAAAVLTVACSDPAPSTDGSGTDGASGSATSSGGLDEPGPTDAGTDNPTSGTTSGVGDSGSADAADSTGIDSGDDETGTTGAPVAPEPSALGPDWLLPIDGVVGLSVTTVPLADGDVGVLVGQAPSANEVVFGVNSGDETSVTLDEFEMVPVMAVVDADTGAVEFAQKLAQRVPTADYGATPRVDFSTVAANGDVFLSMSASGITTFLDLDGTGYTTLSVYTGDPQMLGRDTYYLRMAPSGDFVDHTTVRAPYSAEHTLPRGSAALPDGGMVVTGTASGESYVGEPIAQNAVPAATYVARLDEAGELLWIRGSTGTPSSCGAPETTADTIYAILPGSGLLFVGSPDQMAVAPLEAPYAGTLGRIDLDGNLQWTVAVEYSPTSSGPCTTLGPDDELFVFGRFDGDFIVRDAAGTATHESYETPRAVVASLDPAGGLQWLREMPSGSTLTSVVGGGGWFVLGVPVPFDLEVDGETVELPDLGQAPEDLLSVVVRLDSDGTIVEAQVLGANLRSAPRWTSAERTGWYVAMAHPCDTTPDSEPERIAYLVSEAGTGLHEVPNGCDAPGNHQRAFVARIGRAAAAG